MKYVYMLQSVEIENRHYVGATVDLRKRLAEHNRGEVLHTRKFLPWKLVGYVAFSDEGKANGFEAYLKTGSGRAFAKRHF